MWYRCTVLVTSPNHSRPTIPRNNYHHERGGFNDNLNFSYINTVNPTVLERRAVSREDNRNRIQSSLVWNTEMSIHAQCICLSLGSSRSRPRVKDLRTSHLFSMQLMEQQVKQGRKEHQERTHHQDSCNWRMETWPSGDMRCSTEHTWDMKKWDAP